MTYLSWDESGPCVLAWPWFVTRFADGETGTPEPGATIEQFYGEY